MQVRAKSKFVRVSPFKLRPFADVVRGKPLNHALSYLKVHEIKRVKPLIKILLSAYANVGNLDAKMKDGISMDQLFIKEIRVDQGPTVTYFKPAAMGRASMQRKRLSHIEVVLEGKN